MALGMHHVVPENPGRRNVEILQTSHPECLAEGIVQQMLGTSVDDDLSLVDFVQGCDADWNLCHMWKYESCRR